MNILSILQIIVSIAIIVLILMQERSSGAGGIFGGAGGAGFYQTRRGLEKFIFALTLILLAAFAALALLNLIL